MRFYGLEYLDYLLCFFFVKLFEQQVHVLFSFSFYRTLHMALNSAVEKTGVLNLLEIPKSGVFRNAHARTRARTRTHYLHEARVTLKCLKKNTTGCQQTYRQLLHPVVH